jgi:hypothetical protein
MGKTMKKSFAISTSLLAALAALAMMSRSQPVAQETSAST